MPEAVKLKNPLVQAPAPLKLQLTELPSENCAVAIPDNWAKDCTSVTLEAVTTEPFETVALEILFATANPAQPTKTKKVKLDDALTNVFPRRTLATCRLHSTGDVYLEAQSAYRKCTMAVGTFQDSGEESTGISCLEVYYLTLGYPFSGQETTVLPLSGGIAA